ncbi:hypothetical protein CTAYLR_004209 [Chrysophaeum taylorii]|uniref:Fe-S oxidoreductase n=1 Tax=Chrysophaeum taylorii TaxID=2483200 RepID=A0AAD7UCK3_9STRA|nr:hypothetical protein CTAYLR_004209 [Chrysophaeum taylorii]
MRGGRVFLARAVRMASATPDVATRVDVANIRLGKPTRYARKREGAWVGLEGLEERIAAEGSLVRETLRDMETDEEFQLTAKRLREEGAAKMTLEEKKRRRRALDALGVPEFGAYVAEHAAADASRRSASVLQLNIGLYCNQACGHCHVESSPKRVEAMSDEVADGCLELLANSPSVSTVDITGGAPELNPAFRRVVAGVRDVERRQEWRKIDIIDRCNLTVLGEPGQEDLAEFLASHRVRVIASLPCYSAKNVNLQRGKGVFDRSIAALRKLNDFGYGIAGSGLALDLVYNPLGAFLPPSQEALEAKYRDELGAEFGIAFTNLFTMTNMPIKRFADFLWRRGELEDYMSLLVRNFNVATVDSLMCRDTVSIGWDGKVYDCDFNQQLGLGLNKPATSNNGLTVFDLRATDDLLDVPLAFDNHCFGCTAGMGSS